MTHVIHVIHLISHVIDAKEEERDDQAEDWPRVSVFGEGSEREASTPQEY